MEDKLFVSAIYPKIVRLKRILTMYQSVFTDIDIKATEEGISLIALPPSNVAVSHLFLSKNDFEVYDYTEDAQVTIDADTFVKIVKRAKARDDLAFEFTEKGLRILIVALGITRTFNLTSLESQNYDKLLESVSKSVNSNSDLTKLIVPTTALDTVVDIAHFTASIFFAAVNSNLKVEGGNISSIFIIPNIKKTVFGKFSTRTIYSYTPFNAVEDNIFEMELADESPMRISFKYDNRSYYEVIVAPEMPEKEEKESILNVPLLDDDLPILDEI